MSKESKELLLSRRNLLKVSGLTLGVVALKAISHQIVGQRPYFKDDSDDSDPQTDENMTQSTQLIPEEIVDQSDAVSSVAEVVDPLENSIIPRELLVDGLKIGYINVTNPNGEQVINVPLILDLAPNDPALDRDGRQMLDKKGHPMSNYEAQLSRGAVLEVRKKSVNPENVYTEQALPGEVGDVFIFGHRVTSIHPDIDGDGYPDKDQPVQKVFFRISDFKPGAVLGLFVNDKAVRYQMNEKVDQDGILVENPDGSQNIDGVSAIRAQNTKGKKQLKLVACHPRGETTHRIVAVFEQIDD